MRYGAVTEWIEGLLARMTVNTDIDAARAAAERLARERGSTVLRERLEIAEQTMDAFNARDVNGFRHSMSSDVEWLPALERGFDGSGYVGHEGVAAYFANLEATWAELRFSAEEYRDLGNQVLALGRIAGRGSRGGVPVDAPMGIVIDFRGLEISRARSFLDHGEALRALGL